MSGYEAELEKYAKGDQIAFNIVESCQGIVAHAYFDNRSEAELLLEPYNLIVLTFSTMNIMARDLINKLWNPKVLIKLTLKPKL